MISSSNVPKSLIILRTKLVNKLTSSLYSKRLVLKTKATLVSVPSLNVSRLQQRIKKFSMLIRAEQIVTPSLKNKLYFNYFNKPFLNNVNQSVWNLWVLFYQYSYQNNTGSNVIFGLRIITNFKGFKTQLEIAIKISYIPTSLR